MSFTEINLVEMVYLAKTPALRRSIFDQLARIAKRKGLTALIQ